QRALRDPAGRAAAGAGDQPAARRQEHRHHPHHQRLLPPAPRRVEHRRGRRAAGRLLPGARHHAARGVRQGRPPGPLHRAAGPPRRRPPLPRDRGLLPPGGAPEHVPPPTKGETTMSDPETGPAPGPVRIGIDVGGTFTDAVAVSAATFELLGQVKVPTSHDHPDGGAHSIITALERLLKEVGVDAGDVGFLAHGTTQATNALLEGDVATIGIVGVGTGYDAFAVRRLRSLGRLRLDSGHRLPVRYAAVRDPGDPEAALAGVDAVLAEGAEVVVAVEPFSVDDSEGERAVLDAAARRGVPATATHEITRLYGLTKRARTAALNAGVMPRMLQTADLVESSIAKAGIGAPLMVMRCDGGVMSLAEMRHRPLLTILSGPAAGVAGALMGERISEGVFLETGG